MAKSSIPIVAKMGLWEIREEERRKERGERER